MTGTSDSPGGSRRVHLPNFCRASNFRSVLPVTTLRAIWRDLNELKQPILMRVNAEDVLAKHVLPHWMLRRLLGYLRSPLSHWVLILTLLCWGAADFSELFWLQCIALAMASFTISCYVSTANLHGGLLSFGAFEPLFLLFCCARCCVATVITARYAYTGRAFFCTGLVGFVIFWASIDSTQIQRRSRICMNVWILAYWTATWYFLVTYQRYSREVLVVKFPFIRDLQIEVDWASQLEHSLATLMVFAAKDIVSEAFTPGESKYLMKPVRFVWFDPGDESGCLKCGDDDSSLKRVSMRLDMDELAHGQARASGFRDVPLRSALYADDDEMAFGRMPSRYHARTVVEKELFIWSLLSLRVGGNLAEAVYQELSTRGSEQVEEEAFLRDWMVVAGKRPALRKLSEDLGDDASRVWAAILINSESAVAVRLIQRQFRCRHARRRLTQAKLMWSVAKRRFPPQVPDCASSPARSSSATVSPQARDSGSSHFVRSVSLLMLQGTDDHEMTLAGSCPPSDSALPQSALRARVPDPLERLEVADIAVEIESCPLAREATIAPSLRGHLGRGWHALPPAPGARPSRPARPKLAALQSLGEAIRETELQPSACDATTSTSDDHISRYVVPAEAVQSTAGLPVLFRPRGGRRAQSCGPSRASRG